MSTTNDLVRCDDDVKEDLRKAVELREHGSTLCKELQDYRHIRLLIYIDKKKKSLLTVPFTLDYLFF